MADRLLIHIMIMLKPKIVIIVGPTAVGKSQLAHKLSLKFDAEIIGADSMQIYKYMDIGTAKPVADARREVAYHVIDIIYPDEDFSAALFREKARKIIFPLFNKNKHNIIIVGGCGLYIKALIRGFLEAPGASLKLREKLKQEADLSGQDYLFEKLKEVDPLSAERIHHHDSFRIMRALEIFRLTGKPLSLLQKEHRFQEKSFQSLQIGLDMDREKIYLGIEERVDRMIAQGLVEEVESLLARGYSSQLKSMQGLGYKQITGYLFGKYNLFEAIRLLKRDTRRYAKRQLTWFKAQPEIEWFKFPAAINKIEKRVERFLEN